jgi:hypothetical protein
MAKGRASDVKQMARSLFKQSATIMLYLWLHVIVGI